MAKKKPSPPRQTEKQTAPKPRQPATLPSKIPSKPQPKPAQISKIPAPVQQRQSKLTDSKPPKVSEFNPQEKTCLMEQKPSRNGGKQSLPKQVFNADLSKSPHTDHRNLEKHSFKTSPSPECARQFKRQSDKENQPLQKSDEARAVCCNPGHQHVYASPAKRNPLATLSGDRLSQRSSCTSD